MREPSGTEGGGGAGRLRASAAGALRRVGARLDAAWPPGTLASRDDWNLPPGPSGPPLIGPVARSLVNPLEGLPALREEWGDAFAFRVGKWWMNVLCHPDHVQHVLQERQRNYNKATKGYDVLRIALGNGLLTAEGESWLQNRRLAQPAFHRRRIRALSERMSEAAADLHERWRDVASRSGELDVAEEMMRVTLRIVCDTVLGTRGDHLAERVAPAITDLLREANRRINAVPEWPLSWPLPANRRIRAAIATLDAIVEEIIAQRRRSGAGDGTSGEDLLGLLMDARDAESGAQMDDRQLRDEVLTMFLAGHETSANLLTFALRLLAENPEVAAAVREEAWAALRGGPATEAHADQLPLVDAVLQEALRLYPPAWLIGRAAIEDDVVGGFDVPAGSVVLLCPWVTQRHPDFWTDPLAFRPQRFLDGAPSHRWAHFPFGGGPRLCIGQHFALVESRIVLATLLQDLRLELPAGSALDLEPLITLRPLHGQPMRLHRS